MNLRNIRYNRQPNPERLEEKEKELIVSRPGSKSVDDQQQQQQDTASKALPASQNPAAAATSVSGPDVASVPLQVDNTSNQSASPKAQAPPSSDPEVCQAIAPTNDPAPDNNWSVKVLPSDHSTSVSPIEKNDENESFLNLDSDNETPSKD